MTTRHMHYTCGCEYVGDLASRSCPYHPSHPAIESAPVEPIPEQPSEDLRKRQWAWVTHGCAVGMLYGDDGEMQCNATKSHAPVDFKRDPWSEIARKLRLVPTGAPAPCVWREMEDGEGKWRKTVMRTTCGLREDADEMRPLSQWPFCPQCGHPLTVER